MQIRHKDKLLRTLQVCSSDLSGGAARAAWRLYRGLRVIGEPSTMFVWNRRSDDEHVVHFAPPRDTMNLVRRRARSVWINRIWQCRPRSVAPGYDAFTEDRSRFGKTPLAQMPEADIINLHWIAGMLDLSTLIDMTLWQPVVWTLHDMNPFTGGCHFDMSCGRWLFDCGCCPQLLSMRKSDRSHYSFLRKNRIYSRLPSSRFSIVAPSRYMADLARSSPLLERFDVRAIPNGLDAEVFSPTDKMTARRQLGLPLERPIVLFVAQSVENRRKGCQFTIDALKGLGDRLTLVSVGSGKSAGGDSQIHLGEIGDDRRLSLIYSAADVFAMTSIQDNLPNTILEAMACRTPTVAFDVGGIGEMVRPGRTGALVSAGDVGALRSAILELLGNSQMLEALRQNCRQVVELEYTLIHQAKAYRELYGQVLSNQEKVSK